MGMTMQCFMEMLASDTDIISKGQTNEQNPVSPLLIASQTYLALAGKKRVEYNIQFYSMILFLICFTRLCSAVVPKHHPNLCIIY